MSRAFLFLIGIHILSAFADAQDRTPKFTEFPSVVEKMKARSVNFAKNPDARTFRTRLSDAIRSGTNFAGHYVIAGWGCGTGCISGAIIDTRTGNVFWPEQFNAIGVLYSGNKYVDEPIAYRKNSRLLVISGIPGQKNDDSPEKPSGIYYYEWKNNRFRQLKFVPKPMD